MRPDGDKAHVRSLWGKLNLNPLWRNGFRHTVDPLDQGQPATKVEVAIADGLQFVQACDAKRSRCATGGVVGYS